MGCTSSSKISFGLILIIIMIFTHAKTLLAEGPNEGNYLNNASTVGRDSNIDTSPAGAGKGGDINYALAGGGRTGRTSSGGGLSNGIGGSATTTSPVKGSSGSSSSNGSTNPTQNPKTYQYSGGNSFFDSATQNYTMASNETYTIGSLAYMEAFQSFQQDDTRKALILEKEGDKYFTLAKQFRDLSNQTKSNSLGYSKEGLQSNLLNDPIAKSLIESYVNQSDENSVDDVLNDIKSGDFELKFKQEKEKSGFVSSDEEASPSEYGEILQQSKTNILIAKSNIRDKIAEFIASSSQEKQADADAENIENTDSYASYIIKEERHPASLPLKEKNIDIVKKTPDESFLNLASEPSAFFQESLSNQDNHSIFQMISNRYAELLRRKRF